MNRLFCILSAGVILASLFACSSPSPTSTQSSTLPIQCDGSGIVIGEVAENITEIIQSVQPLADYLAKQLAPSGITCGQVMVPASTAEVTQLIKDGEVDIYWDSLYPASLVHAASSAQPVLIRHRNCDPEYYSVILARADSGINSLQDLSGHLIAMDHPESTSGFALPAVYLLDQGLKLVVKSSYNEAVAEGEIGIVFSHGDPNTLDWILTGKVDAAATDDFFYGRLDDQQRGSLKLLAQTQSVPRQVVLVRPGLDPAMQQAIIDVLLNADQNPDGLEAMEHAAGTCRFEQLPNSIEATIAQMVEVSNKVRSIPGLP